MASHRPAEDVFDGDEISVTLDEFTDLDSVRLTDDGDHTGELFDGYPQVVTDQESEPEYEIRKETDVMVEMRDNVELAVDIYRPDTDEETFPTILSWGRWNKDVQAATEWLKEEPQAYLESPFWDGALEAGDFTYLVPRGYAHVIPNPRGVGESGGKYHESPENQLKPSDIYDTIEWISGQDWATDSVGMIGPSNYSRSQMAVAPDPHPNLEALFPWGNASGTGEHFTGIFDTSIHHVYMGRHGNDAGLPSPNHEYRPPKPHVLSLPDEDLDERLEEAKSHPDIKHNSKWYSYLVNPWKWPTTYTLDALVSAYSSPHWEFWPPDPNVERVEEIDLPIYTGAPWSERLYLWPTMEAWESVGTTDDEKKLTMGPPGHAPRPYTWFHDEKVRWFDTWLKDEETGIQEEPPIKLFVMGKNKWKFENEWPLERTDWQKLYLHPGGTVAAEQPDPDSEPERFTQPAPYEDSTVYCRRYATEPVDEPMEITGPLSFYLEASIDQDDTNWIVDVVDRGPDDDRQLVSQGYLKAQYRELDEERSKEWKPIHPQSEPDPVPENEPVQYAIDMMPTSVILQPEHQLEIIIRNQDDLNSTDGLNGIYLMPHMETVTHDIHFGDSYLLAPIIE